MSGLAAVLSRDGRAASASSVLAMLEAIPYRGPAGGIARDFGRAVLGSADMRVTATDRLACQPLVSPRTGCAVIADARLDNRAQLLAHLGGTAGETSDAALILRAYEYWGLQAPRHLLGDFAFVLWDPRIDRLVCARDGAGQRTLFYRVDAQEFAAASEIHQLLQDRRIRIEPDHARIRTALLPINIHQNELEQAATYYVGVRSLEPGHTLVVDRHGISVERFWKLEPPPMLHYRRPEAYVEHFRELFFMAVAARLCTSGPLGALLSGGLDSSSIVCAALELFRSGAVPDPGFATFSAVFDGQEFDERGLIQSVHAQASTDYPAHYLAPDAEYEWQPLCPNGFRQRPELPTMGIATLLDAARSTQTRVLLTGEVADTYLRGSPYVIDSLLRQTELAAVPRYLAAMHATSSSSLPKTLALYVLAPLLPRALHAGAMRAAINRQQRLDAWRLVPDWIPDPLRSALLANNRELALEREARRKRANETRHMQLLSLDPPETASIPAGWPVEIWRPFADRRLIEFALAIPPEHLYEPVSNDPTGYGGSKQLLRRGLKDLLPEPIRTNTRPTNFAGSFSDLLNRGWERFEASFGPRGRSMVAELGYVDQARLWTRLQALRATHRGADFRYVNYIVGLETWLQGLNAPRSQSAQVATSVRRAPARLVNGDESLVDAMAGTHSPTGSPAERTTLA
jgi:asparagine synthase (glutamine-hydrolysing)